MSTLAEQVVAQLKTDMDNVYDAGYQKGAKESDGYGVGYSRGQNDFGIPNEVTGTNIVTCDYVNENEHNVEVKLSSDTITDFSGVEVKACEQNILQYPFRGGMSKVFTDNGDGSVTVDVPTSIGANQYCWLTGYYEEKLLCLPAGTYTFSDNGLVSATHLTNRYSLSKLNNDGTYTFLGQLGTYTFNEPTKIRFALQVAAGKVVNKTTFYPMITVNEYVDNFKPYTEKTYTANADGTVEGITSISPVMTLICDTEGVNISAKYYCAPSAEYDRFWDKFQEYGKRTIYLYGFAGSGWTDDTFKIKYDLKPENMDYCFSNSSIVDLKGILDKTNRKIDFSSCTTMSNILNGAKAKTFPDIDVTNLSNLNSLFFSARYLESINISGIKVTQKYVSTFLNCYRLKEVQLEGEVGDTLNLQWSSLLEVESAKNIIQCLANLIETDPFTKTITFHANVWSALDAEGNASPNGNAWKDYIQDIGWNYG